MRADIKARWIAALESGDYKQGRNFLHNLTDNSYCCLGVLCDLAVQDGIIDPPTAITSHVEGVEGETLAVYGGQHATLPDKVWRWAGFGSNNPAIKIEARFPYESSSMYLTEMNDLYEYTFQDISKEIKEHF